MWKKSKRYARYPIVWRHNESKYKFFQRIIFDVILTEFTRLTLHELEEEIYQATGYTAQPWFLLRTIVFPNSGIVIRGDVITFEADQGTGDLIGLYAKMEIERAKGSLERQELFRRIQRKIRFSEAEISRALFHRGSPFRWKMQNGRAMIYMR